MLTAMPSRLVYQRPSHTRSRPTVRETAPAYGDDPADPAIPQAGSAQADCPADLGFPEAGTVHELLKALHGIGNEVRLRFLDALRMLNDGNLFYELGYSSFQQYCDRELGLARSTSHEYVRVARALDSLPRLRVLFAQGELSWEQVRSITRVASADTEVSWIELAFDEPVRSLLAEVREARRTGRDAPRDKRHGLPNLMVRLCIDLTIEDKERVRAAFERVSSALGPELGGGPDASEARQRDGSSDSRPPLVRWADGILSGAIPASPSAPDGASGPVAKRPAPAQTILYRTCPECRESTLDTVEGPISVAPERVAELAPDSNHVEIPVDEEMRAQVMPAGEIDEPNSPRLARQVLHRDGLRCMNPGCYRKHELHAHHMVYRSRGGATDLPNLIAVCDTCHALLHDGLLEIYGSLDTGITWQPRPVATGVKVREAAALHERLRELSAALPTPNPRRVDPDRPAQARLGESTYVDSASSCVDIANAFTPERMSDLTEGLVRLGCSRSDGENRVREAIATLMAAKRSEMGGSGALGPLDDAAILTQALRHD